MVLRSENVTIATTILEYNNNLKREIMELKKYEEAQRKFELACSQAEGLSLMQNAGAAFQAVVVVKTLRELLTDEIMKAVFMPLMNTKIGFLTDRTGKKNKQGIVKPLYSIEIVRDVIIDAAAFGLLPTFNQINIIADRMYPTKEGFTYLLKKMGVKYILNFGEDTTTSNAKFANIIVKINYKLKDGEDQKPFVMTAVVPKNAYSTYDQLKGKAERRAKKMLYEYVTGLDLGENDGDSISTSNNVENADSSQYDELKFKSEAEAREFFIKDQGFTKESVAGEKLFTTAEGEGIDVVIGGISYLKLRSLKAKKDKLKKDSEPTLM